MGLHYGESDTKPGNIFSEGGSFDLGMLWDMVSNFDPADMVFGANEMLEGGMNDIDRILGNISTAAGFSTAPWGDEGYQQDILSMSPFSENYPEESLIGSTVTDTMDAIANITEPGGGWTAAMMFPFAPVMRPLQKAMPKPGSLLNKPDFKEKLQASVASSQKQGDGITIDYDLDSEGFPKKSTTIMHKSPFKQTEWSDGPLFPAQTQGAFGKFEPLETHGGALHYEIVEEALKGGTGEGQVFRRHRF